MAGSFSNNLTAAQALQKLKHYCAYQERSHQEVVTKLYALKISSHQHTAIIAQLIEENYLNEERFAQAYARGKMRMNHWGRKKIELHLQAKAISPYCIKNALKNLDIDEYDEVLKKEFQKKWEACKGLPEYNRFFKTKQYLLSRGFESSMIDACREG